MADVKGMWCDVLKPANGGDCTNGGISSENVRLLLVGPNVPEIFNADENVAVQLVTRNLRDRKGRPFEYMHVEPLAGPCADHAGWMAGGNFVWSSDSRFPSDQPISIHDRKETWELYEVMSR